MNENAVVTIRPDELMRRSAWIATRDAMVSQAAAIQAVESEEQLDASGALQTELGKHIRALEKERKTITEPIDKLKKDIMDQEKAMRADLERQRDRLKSMNDAYATKCAIEAQAERKRLAQEEEHRRIEEAQRQIEAQELFGAEAVVAPVPVIAPPPPPPTQPKLSNSRQVKRWSFVIEDVLKVPREYMIVDDQKVRAQINYCTKMEIDPVIPGIKFEARISVEGR